MAKNEKWYSIRAAAEKSAEVYIYGDIGESWYEDSVTAASFVKEIAALDVETLNVRINSYGGSVTDGLAIYNALRRHKATVVVTIDGIAASIASLIAMAGDTVSIAENGLMMLHAPWGAFYGNATEMREHADVLDKHAEAMAFSYAAKTGRPLDEMRALLADGVDHWYGAAEALDEKLVDDVVSAMPIAASFDLSRYHSIPAAAAAYSSHKEAQAMTKKTESAAPENNTDATTTVTQPTVQAATPTVNADEIAAQALVRDAKRRGDIAAAFSRFTTHDGVSELLAACQSDVKCTLEQANAKLLAHLGKGAEPAGGHYVVSGEDERDKFRAGVTAAILVRAGHKPPKADANIELNPYRGMKLLDIARESLVRAGINVRGMDQMRVVGLAFTQSTSDFPILLENTMHKAMQTAFAAAADTYTRFCYIGSVGDFRAHNRYRTGSLGNLDDLTELGEFKNKSLPDGRKSSITAGTKGNIINISRQVIVNDDLDAFVGVSAWLGRAAKRTVEAAVYSALASNSAAGPTMGDGNPLFHASHNNIAGTAAVPSMDSFEAARVLMASQKDISGNDYLDLRPSVWLGPIGIGGKAREVNAAEYNDEAQKTQRRPNVVRGLVRDIVDTPRLTGTRWYLFADPNEAPALEVAFLDGQSEPFLELENGFTVDGARWKGRLDFGVAGRDWEGAVTNAGV